MTTLTKEEMNSELDELTFQLVILSQNLVDTKLTLEQFMKEGFINLAQSRYGSYNEITSTDFKLNHLRVIYKPCRQSRGRGGLENFHITKIHFIKE